MRFFDPIFIQYIIINWAAAGAGAGCPAPNEKPPNERHNGRRLWCQPKMLDLCSIGHSLFGSRNRLGERSLNDHLKTLSWTGQLDKVLTQHIANDSVNTLS
jgi:hypothetical protein